MLLSRFICNCTRDWILIRKSVNLTSLLVSAKKKPNCFCREWETMQLEAIYVYCHFADVGSEIGWKERGKMFILWQNKRRKKCFSMLIESRKYNVHNKRIFYVIRVGRFFLFPCGIFMGFLWARFFFVGFKVMWEKFDAKAAESQKLSLTASDKTLQKSHWICKEKFSIWLYTSFPKSFSFRTFAVNALTNFLP